MLIMIWKLTASVRWESISKPTIENISIFEISNDNWEKTKSMFIFRNQSARNKSFGNVAKLVHSGTRVENKN
jgi:hypothetical protein